MNMDITAVIVVIGWLVSLAVALFVVPKLAAKRAMENFGLTQVEQNGQKLFVPVDMNGDPVKVPIGTKKLEDGTEEIVYAYSTLPITLIYMVASETAKYVKMSVMGTKSGLSKALAKAGLGEELKEAGIDAATAALIDSLPAKAKPIALLVARVLKGTGTPQGGQQTRRGGPI